MDIDLTSEIDALTRKSLTREEFLLETARAIQRRFPHFNWVGFYFLHNRRLEVGPYVGKPTPHTVIDLDRGVCGAAVRQKETIVVDDVNADPRYLACSLETKSEIVIPLRVKGEIVGELDIDSAQKAAFGPDETKLLEAIARRVGAWLERF